MTDTTFKLNHPWTIYLREPLSSYTRYSIYHAELLRLLNFVQDLSTDIAHLKENQSEKVLDCTSSCTREKVQLTNFIIGTPMEDALHKKNCSHIYMDQWQQLFPYHITKFINHYSKLDNDININVIIISPDDIFMDENYREPLFTTKCTDYTFTKIKNREYIYSEENLTIKIDIFTCPFPQLEKNAHLIHKSYELIKKTVTYELDSLAPTESDIDFIDCFYKSLELIASNPLSNMIINSWATFRNVREYDNFGLFKSLLELANKHKIIATEWGFSENNYFFKVLSSIKFTVDYIKYGVSYINPDFSPYLIEKYQKISPKEIALIKKDSFSVMAHKSVLCILIKFPYNKLVLRKIYYGY
jgi:hypothetical protein